MRRISVCACLLAGTGALLAAAAGPASAGAPRVADFSRSVPADSLRARTAATGPVLTKPLRAPQRFDLLGVRWRGAGNVDVELRVRRDGGRWSRWVTAQGAEDHGPDGPFPVSGTDPVWAGGADSFQLRLSRPARGLRVHFVRSRAAGAAALRRHRSRARSAAGQPNIIPRAAWGGGGCQPSSSPAYGDVQVAFVHHTVSINEYSAQDSAGIVLGICRFHRDSNGWSDIGYNFLVDKYGQVFEGRAGGIDRAVVGAQAQGYNGRSTGIANIGTFNAAGQSDAGLRALAQLTAWKLGVHGAPPTGQTVVNSAGGATNRFPSGTPVTFERISGHRDADSTECPGGALYGQLPTLRQLAAGQGGPPSGPAAALTLSPGQSKLQYPAPAEISGKLSVRDGPPVAPRTPVEVQVRNLGGRWVSVATATTEPDGSWSASLKTGRTVAVRALWRGDAGHPAVASAGTRITVVPQLQLKASPKRLRAGQAVKVAAQIGPSKKRASILLERRGSGGAAAPRTVRLRGGRVHTRLRLPSAGLYRVRLSFAGDKRNPRVTSAPAFVRALPSRKAKRKARKR